MANAKQLGVVKKGAGVWNKWRAKNIADEADLSGADLHVLILGKLISLNLT